MDWDGSAVNYTCFTYKYQIPLRQNVEPYITCDKLPSVDYSVFI